MQPIIASLSSSGLSTALTTAFNCTITARTKHMACDMRCIGAVLNLLDEGCELYFAFNQTR